MIKSNARTPFPILPPLAVGSGEVADDPPVAMLRKAQLGNIREFRSALDGGGQGAGAIPPASRGAAGPGDPHDSAGLFSGIHLVLTGRYLLLLALLILILNRVNTTGEYILAELVARHADATVQAGGFGTRGEAIAAFYGGYCLTVNIATLLTSRSSSPPG